MFKKLMEAAPPNKKIEKWIIDNKKSFKDKYGDDWEKVLYSTAWKRYKSLNENNGFKFKRKMNIVEHKNYEDYIKKWIERGFDISVEDYKIKDEDGKRFIVNDHVILEPITGKYYIEKVNQPFSSFDDALRAIFF